MFIPLHDREQDFMPSCMRIHDNPWLEILDCFCVSNAIWMCWLAGVVFPLRKLSGLYYSFHLFKKYNLDGKYLTLKSHLSLIIGGKVALTLSLIAFNLSLSILVFHLHAGFSRKWCWTNQRGYSFHIPSISFVASCNENPNEYWPVKRTALRYQYTRCKSIISTINPFV